MNEEKNVYVCDTVSKTIKDVCGDVCNNFCEYRTSKATNQFGRCDYQATYGFCPLDRL